MAEITHKMTLSTTEPNNYVGLIKVRQADDETQVFDVTVTENGAIKQFTGLKPFFCLMAREITGQGVSENVVNHFDSLEGKLKYTLTSNEFQMLGKNEAYFSFRTETKDGRWVEQFSTRTFQYTVEKSIYTQPFKDSNYWVTFKELYRLFTNYIDSGKTDWEEFVNQNKDILASVDPGGELLKEIIDAREGSESLNDRLKNLIQYSKQLSPIINEVPDDRITQILDFKNRINSNQDVFKCLYYRDLHYMKSVNADTTNNFAYGQATLKSLDQLKCGALLTDLVDCAVFNGDNVHGDEPINLTRVRNKQVANIAYEVMREKPVFWGLGNHDDTGDYGFGDEHAPRAFDQVIHLDEYPSLWELDMHDEGQNRPEGKTYSFMDFPDGKVRVIMLNGFENPELIDDGGNVKYARIDSSVFDQKQISWLANEALMNVPEGYAVIAFTHCPLEGFFSNAPYWSDTEKPYKNVGHNLVLNIFSAFRTGSRYSGIESNADYPSEIDVDYSLQGTRDVVGLFFGHEHWDAEVQEIAGIKGVLRTCNIPNQASRVIGTNTEFAIDVIEINQSAKTCVVKRCGAGKDLEFNY